MTALPDDAATRAALDSAIKNSTEGLVRDGEVITRWRVLAATQSWDGGGVFITMVDDDAVLLREGLASVESDAERDRQ